MKVVAIIQARLGSTRLPRKCIQYIGDKRMIDHVIQRALLIDGVDKVVMNIPLGDSELDRPTLTYQIQNQEQDVLGSFLKVATLEHADVIMRLTGDCPLLDPYLCTDVLRLFLKQGLEYCYVANDTTRSGYPDGTDCEVFSMQGLEEAAECATEAFDREHVTVYMRRFWPCLGILTNYGKDYSALKCSVDTEQDLVRARTICAVLHNEPGYSVKDTYRAWLLAGSP